VVVIGRLKAQPMAAPGRSKTCGWHKVSRAGFVRRARSAPPVDIYVRADHT